jgi:hypothetical protein
MADNKNKQVYTLGIKTEQKVESEELKSIVPLVPESAYHKFRHFMYNHLQNKWVRTVLLALLGAAIIVALEVIFKIVRGH